MSIFKQIQADLNPAYLSAFGTLETGELEPVFQGDFIYGLNTQLWNTAVTSGTGATVDTNSGRLRIQSGTSSNGYAYITSRKIIKYRAGQGNVVRLTPLFTVGVASNVQMWGVGEISSNLPLNGYFFGYSGTTFGIFHHNNSTTATFIPQASWNGDICTGAGASGFNWNSAYGTPVMIKYPYLGYGNIEFFVLNPTTSTWILCHVIKYANTSASTQLGNPSMQILGFTLNSGNTTNQIMYTGSVAAFLSGERNFDSGPRWAADVPTKTVAASETYICSLRNATTYNGVTNRGSIKLNSFSVGGTTNNQQILIRFRVGVTLTGSPAFTTISGSTADNGVTITSGNSVASFDTAATYTAATGNYIFNLSMGIGASSQVDLSSFNIFINPGETLTILGIASGNYTCSISLNWMEEI